MEKTPVDFLSLLDYSNSDIVSAGMNRDLWVSGVAADDRMRFDYGYDYTPDTRTDEEKWECIKPFWPYIKNIGSGYLVQKALKILCGVDDLLDDTISGIKSSLEQLRDNSSYKELLLYRAGIDTVLGVTMNISENPSTDIIRQQLYVDIYTGIQNRRQLYRLEQLSGVSIYNLKSYVDALDTFIEKQIQQGIVAFKWHFFSYMRPLVFELVDPFEAEQALNKILLLPMRGATGSAVNVGFEEMKPLLSLLKKTGST